MNEELDLEGQPNGLRIESTLAVVSNVLADHEFAREVAKHNGWDLKVHHGDNFQQRVALLFLASRYQWAVDLLSRQTATLKTQMDTLIATCNLDR